MSFLDRFRTPKPREITVEDAEALFIGNRLDEKIDHKIDLTPRGHETRLWVLKGGVTSTDTDSPEWERWKKFDELVTAYRDEHIRNDPWVIEEAKKIPPQEFLIFKFPKGTDASKEDIKRLESVVRLALQRKVDLLPAKRTLAGFSIDSVK